MQESDRSHTDSLAGSRSLTGVAYSTMLLDLDHTLFDFDASELAAFADALTLAGGDHPMTHFPTYQRINDALWSAVEAGEMRPGDVRTIRFHHLADEIGLDLDHATVVAMADAFAFGLGAHGELYPGTRDVLDALAERVPLGLITNGLSEVVHARLARLDIADHFRAVVISQEVGVSKPKPGIFERAFELLGNPSKDSTVMVGDSLSSDIAGGANYGISTCWYNPHRAQPSESDEITHQISHLADLLNLI